MSEKEERVDALLAKASEYERLAEEMRKIGDLAAADSFQTIASSYLEDAAAEAAK